MAISSPTAPKNKKPFAVNKFGGVLFHLIPRKVGQKLPSQQHFFVNENG
jgi:hypothetical protein